MAMDNKMFFSLPKELQLECLDFIRPVRVLVFTTYQGALFDIFPVANCLPVKTVISSSVNERYGTVDEVFYNRYILESSFLEIYHVYAIDDEGNENGNEFDSGCLDKFECLRSIDFDIVSNVDFVNISYRSKFDEFADVDTLRNVSAEQCLAPISQFFNKKATVVLIDEQEDDVVTSYYDEKVSRFVDRISESYENVGITCLLPHDLRVNVNFQ